MTTTQLVLISLGVLIAVLVVSLVPIIEPVLTRQLVLCTASNKHPSATVQALIRIIREEAGRLELPHR